MVNDGDSRVFKVEEVCWLPVDFHLGPESCVFDIGYRGGQPNWGSVDHWQLP